MDLGLNDKVVLITGGSKGIGLACASAFLAEGARVALASRSAVNLREAQAALRSEGHEVFTVEADLTASGAATRMVEAVGAALGAPSVLVNSAGAARRTPIAELTEADWRAGMDAKYFPYVNAMTACLPVMVQAGGGAIVNVIGMGGKQATPTHLPGGAANAALMLVNAGIANGYASKGIRVNAVSPGPTLTARLKQGIAAEARHLGVSEDEAARQSTARMALGRHAAPEEIANVVVFLSSDKASYVNGITMSLDGSTLPTIL